MDDRFASAICLKQNMHRAKIDPRESYAEGQDRPQRRLAISVDVRLAAGSLSEANCGWEHAIRVLFRSALGDLLHGVAASPLKPYCAFRFYAIVHV